MGMRWRESWVEEMGFQPLVPGERKIGLGHSHLL